MSKTAADADFDPDEDVEATDGDADRESEAPDVEEDLFEEELRIDGICGVY